MVDDFMLKPYDREIVLRVGNCGDVFSSRGRRAKSPVTEQGGGTHRRLSRAMRHAGGAVDLDYAPEGRSVVIANAALATQSAIGAGETLARK